MTRMYTSRDVIKILKARVSEVGSQTQLAKIFNISPGYLNDVLSGRKMPGKAIAEGLNLNVINCFTERKKR